MTRIPFTKMVATGNDFIVVDARTRRLIADRRWPSVSRALCDRRTGIGADGVLLLECSKRADVKMRIFNADGSEAEMCGNGARCVALYLQTHGAWHGLRKRDRHRNITIETLGGRVHAAVSGSRISMQMPTPSELRLNRTVRVRGRSIRLGTVNTGVPHAVVPVSSLQDVDVKELGRALRHHAAFLPCGTNVNFIQADTRHPNRVQVRTYERGVEDETPACGTGVAASAVIHAVTQSNGHPSRRRIHVVTRSGAQLVVSCVVTSATHRPIVTDVILEGPARRVYEGTYELKQ